MLFIDNRLICDIIKGDKLCKKLGGLMSCHNIGQGLNTVVKVVLEEYDKGLIPYESAHKIIKQARNAVNFCDGNTYEAIEVFEFQKRCTCCLEKKEVMNVYDLPKDFEFSMHKSAKYENSLSLSLQAINK